MANSNAKYMTADSTRPAHKIIALTASDSTVLDVTRGLYIGTGGTVAVVPVDGDTSVIFTNVANGTILPIQVTKVLSTGTSASDILGLW